MGKFSDNMNEVCKTLCKICDKPFSLTGMRSHTKSCHDMKITQYKERFNQIAFDIIERIFHHCKICGKTMLFDGDTVGAHVKNAHKSSHTHKTYNDQFLKKNTMAKKKPFFMTESEAKIIEAERLEVLKTDKFEHFVNESGKTNLEKVNSEYDQIDTVYTEDTDSFENENSAEEETEVDNVGDRADSLVGEFRKFHALMGVEGEELGSFGAIEQVLACD